ncbi:MAG: glycogen-binding domain-containing protein [Verrucomicrobia bacterium]|nr:glycogen-binding domain-containing protein [Verrucomicrobiota bacterium]
MENDLKKPTGGKRIGVGRPTKKTTPAPLPPEASARVSAAAAAAGAVKPAFAPIPAAPAKSVAPAPAQPAKPAAPLMVRPVPPAPKIAPPTVVPVSARKVEMSFDAPFAKFVNIAGDFNAWEMTTLTLRKSDSVWKITLELKPGTYQYKFLVDGEWVNDPNNVRTTPNQFGSLNNVLEVG